MASSAVEIRRHLDDMRRRGLAETTIACRRRTVHRMERAIGKPALRVTAADLDGYQELWTMSSASRATEAIHLKGWFRWAVEHRLLREDPSRVLAVPQRKANVPRPIAEDRLAAALRDAPDRIRPWLVLAACGGLRACEIARLERADVLDQVDPPLLLIKGKGGRQRTINLTKPITAALEAHGLPVRGPVFRRHDGKPGAVSPLLVSSLANRYLHGVGIPDTLHSLRHRAATMIYRSQRDILVTQRFLGHANVATTQVYAAFAPDALAAAQAAVGLPEGA